MNAKTGAILVGVGVFFIVLLNIRWGDVPNLVKAYAILGMGLVCIAAFFTAQGSQGEVVQAGTEVTYQVASAIAAAVIIGSILASLGGFPFWDIFEEDGWGERASRDFQLEGQVLSEDAAVLVVNVTSMDLEILSWGNPEIAANGTITVFAGSAEKAEEYLNETSISITRGPDKGLPLYRIEVDSPERRTSFGRRAYHLDLTVRVPSTAKMDLDLRLVSGNIDLEELTVGRSKLKGVSGKVSFDGVVGDVLNVSVVSGEVIGSLTFEEATLSAVSGDMDLEMGSSSGTYRLKSTSGGITAWVPTGDQVGLSLKGSTLTGEVDFPISDLEFSVEKKRQKRAQTPGYADKEVRIAIWMSTLTGDIGARAGSS